MPLVLDHVLGQTLCYASSTPSALALAGCWGSRAVAFRCCGFSSKPEKGNSGVVLGAFPAWPCLAEVRAHWFRRVGCPEPIRASVGTCTTGCGSACPTFPGAAGLLGTEVQEEQGWVPYSRHWDGADPRHICRIRVRSGPTCCTSGKDWSGCGRAERLSVPGRPPQRLSGGVGSRDGKRGYSPAGASWWGVIFCKDKLQGK